MKQYTLEFEGKRPIGKIEGNTQRLFGGKHKFVKIIQINSL